MASGEQSNTTYRQLKMVRYDKLHSKLNYGKASGNAHLPWDTAADEEDVNVEVGTDLVFLEISEPKVAEGVVSIGVVFAIISKNISQVRRNLVVEVSQSMLRIKSEGNGNDLKQKMI